MNTVEGIIEEIIFKNEANGYCVCELNCNEDLIIIVGYIPFVCVGESLRVTGKWTTHPDYGEQLKIEYYEKVEPTTVSAIEKYLSSGIIQGVGPATAKKIVDTFGESAIFVIENEPHKLSIIRGISIDKAVIISNSFMQQRELKQVVMYLQKYDISPSFAVKIYKAFGSDTIKEINENPYKLSDEIYGIGFKRADKIAMSIGIDKNSEYRLCSGIKYVLNWFCAQGHTYMPKEELIRYSCDLLEAEEPSLENALIRLTIDRHIFIEEINNECRVYLSSFYHAELGVVKKLYDLQLHHKNVIDVDIDERIKNIELQSGIILEELQKTAIKEAFNNGVLVITGGPGTGKTTIINTMLKIFDQLRYHVALTAPTGRAAKKMTEACGKEAKTIHRLLEIGYIDNEEQEFARNEANPLEYDVVIVDEVSMVDVLLMNSLLKAILPGTILILVGDTDQLPSVGPGKVLKDIISSNAIKVVRLTEIFRQAIESMIIVNAHKINKGDMPYLNTKENDFFFIKKASDTGALGEVIGLVNKRLPEFMSLKPSNIQVLTPMRKGLLGVISLNNELQEVLNPPSKKKNEKIVSGIAYREGDRVMQIKNNYNTVWESINTKEKGCGVFNGDMGYIAAIDKEMNCISVLFDEEREVIYDYSELDELELAYAITVHKSQGSEFPVVVIPIINAPSMLMTRNLIYTAITRAKSLVVLVGREECLKQMILNNHESKRYSGLEDRLKSVNSKGLD